MSMSASTVDYDGSLPNREKPKLGTHGSEHRDSGAMPVRITRSTYIYAMCAAVNSCNLGYDIGVSTEAGRLIQDDMNLTRIQRELFVGSISFWAMFGALVSQYTTDASGRRKTFIIAAVAFIIGILIMSAAQSYGILMFGRFFVGMGVGVGLAIDPLYIAEVTPAKFRGEMVTWSEIALNVGIVLGFSTGLFLGGIEDDREWRVMFLLGGILPVVMVLLVCFVMPESPRWLVSKERDDEAYQILRLIYPEGYDVNLVLSEIKEAVQREKVAESLIGWGAIFRPTPSVRRMLIVGVGTAIAQQAVGIDSIQYYLLDLIQESGIDTREKQSLLLIFLGFLKLVFIVVGGKLFDKSGRRPLFFASLLGMAGSLLFVSVAFFIDTTLSTGITITGIACYLAFFSIGMGPGAWLIPSEVFATCIRAKAMSIATFMNRAAATLMASTFLSTANAMGWGGFFLMLSFVCIVCFVFLYLYLPETKGRSLEEMSVYFAEITNDTAILEAEKQVNREGITEVETQDRNNIGAGKEII